MVTVERSVTIMRMTTVTTTSITIMTDAHYHLMTWLSPAYPVGAFSYSHGIEYGVEVGLITDRASLQDWIEDCVQFGAGRNDAILLAHAWHSETHEERAALVELAQALQPAAERLLESQAQGAAFQIITATVWPAEGVTDAPMPYPVAFGIAARAHNVALAPALQAFLWAYVGNLVSAGVRLVPLGQTDGQRIQAALMEIVAHVAREAETATLDDIGGCAICADIAAMQHETQHVRLFRS
jgi:urease accessory protein